MFARFPAACGWTADKAFKKANFSITAKKENTTITAGSRCSPSESHLSPQAAREVQDNS